MPFLYIIRGLPGSGKSTFAKSIGCFHLETDMYHIRDGIYKYDRNTLSEGISFCNTVNEAVMRKYKIDIAVSGVFAKLSSLFDLLDLADMHGYKVQIHNMRCDYGSIHDVPEDHMINFQNYWQEISDYDYIQKMLEEKGIKIFEHSKREKNWQNFVDDKLKEFL